MYLTLLAIQIIIFNKLVGEDLKKLDNVSKLRVKRAIETRLIVV